MAGRGVAAATLVLLAGALLVVTEILTSDTLITMTLRKYYANGGEPGDLVVPALGTLDSISNPNALALRQLRSRQLALEPGPEAEAEAGAGPPRRRPPARVYVVTLDDVPGAAAANRGRYEAFLEAWTRTCGDQLAFVRCPGVVDGRQGYGLTKAYVACIERAIQERAATDDHGDAPVLFMEDDSRLFLEDGGEFCKASTRQRLWAAAPSDAFVIMLGGHTFTYPSAAAGGVPGFRMIKHSFGSYAFAVPAKHLAALRGGFSRDLARDVRVKAARPAGSAAARPTVSPDVSWFTSALLANAYVYATEPLMIRHEPGYSNTRADHVGLNVSDRYHPRCHTKGQAQGAGPRADRKGGGSHERGVHCVRDAAR